MTTDQPTPNEPAKPQKMLGTAQIADLFGVNQQTVRMWRTRYADTHPCPVPDVEVGEGKKIVAGWRPSRIPDWEEWDRTRAKATAQREAVAGKVTQLETQLNEVKANLRAAKGKLKDTAPSTRTVSHGDTCPTG